MICCVIYKVIYFIFLKMLIILLIPIKYAWVFLLIQVFIILVLQIWYSHVARVKVRGFCLTSIPSLSVQRKHNAKQYLYFNPGISGQDRLAAKHDGSRRKCSRSTRTAETALKTRRCLHVSIYKQKYREIVKTMNTVTKCHIFQRNCTETLYYFFKITHWLFRCTYLNKFT